MSRRHLPQILAYMTPFPFSIVVDAAVPLEEVAAQMAGPRRGCLRP